MFSQLIYKLMYSIVVLLMVIITVSSIIYLAPVDPTRLSFGQMADAGTIEKKKERLGLDKPLPVQLMYYINDISPISIYRTSELSELPVTKSALSLSSTHSLVLKMPYLRESFQSGRKVSELIGEALPKTLILAFASLLFALLIGIPLGIICALNRDKMADRAIIAFSTLGVSLPSYIPAIMFAVFFGYVWSSLTGLDVQGSIIELNDLGNEEIRIRNLILPVLALGIRPVAMITQLSRSAFLDVMNQEYIKTAKAKGVRLVSLLYRHALPNASITIISASSGWLATLIAGSYFVESIFNFKGIGDLTISSLTSFDIPVILGTLITVCIFFIIINLVVDMLYTKVDPRIKVN
ncbi:MAG TPA: ABC transporter permease [Saprospiraceae bacterium]|nr:ABC transporter permease [Saprospiraceae bacterium]MCC6689781.1 ABC transporter permease [Saprospiraceae bacterium]HMV24706.1 ABC transporter permease [Saprospiraceae bacterium]HMW74447.1 ABC transporter permease [Saprospiraceae bacterium]HMX86694.1 ABC transporter permease [Saprospiraceae bacterium]